MKVIYDAVGSVDSKLVKYLIDLFEVEAVCGGRQCSVHLRVAKHENAIYVDLANDSWEQVRIDESGWAVLSESPVKFRRTEGMGPLPTPVHGANPKGVLRLVNLRPHHQHLFLTWLVHSFRPDVPYPVLALSGPQGRGKSTISTIARRLVDPSESELMEPPKSRRDLAIAAHNSHLVVLDNLSSISDDFSDSICRLATGGCYRNRRLYTDSDEEFFTYKRPTIVNGIAELATRGDLLDRSLLLRGIEIADFRADILKDFDVHHGAFLGSLLDVLSAGLKALPDVNEKMPRMADFCRLGIATEIAQGYPKGSFMAAYDENLDEIQLTSFEASPIAVVIFRLLKSIGESGWKGTALELLQKLHDFIGDPAQSDDSITQLLKHQKFPKTANALSAELARVGPALTRLGVSFTRGRTHWGRYIVLKLAVAKGKEAAA
jgi:hypothetical protein